MTFTVVFRARDHFLKTRKGRGQQEIIIRITKYSGKDAIDCTAETTFLEVLKETVTVKTVGEASKYFTLTNSVANSKTGGDLVVEADVTKLVEVAEDNESEEDEADSLHHLAEQDREPTEVKCF